MQAVIHLNKELYSQELFTNLSKNPFELKVCGKDILDYYFDFFKQNNITKVYFNLLVEVDLSKFEKYEQMGFELDFFNYNSLQKFYQESFSQVSFEELLCIENIGFFDFDKEIFSYDFRCSNSDFSVSYITNHKLDLVIEELKPYLGSGFIMGLESFRDYFLVTKYVLQNTTQFELKNYNNQESILIGKDTNIHNSVKLIEPVIIDDEVQIAKNSIIGPNVIVHKAVVIQEDCEIKDSIVYENTFITQGLLLDLKLVFKENLYDFSMDILYKIDNKFISKSRVNLFEKLFNFIK